MITRRTAIKQSALIVTACAAAPAILPLPSRAADAPAAGFKLPPLPYAFDALEPHIDAKTMEIHHDKHHQAYITNLNKALDGKPELLQLPIEDLVRGTGRVAAAVRMAVRNHGGGHYNHSLFWQMMKQGGGGEPKGGLAKAMDAKFGSFGAFQEAFAKAATTQFGSGWAWLTFDGRELVVEQTPNQDSPLALNRTPLLGLDVWEHAYYLKYQNRRPDYVAAFFKVINWDFVAERYEKFKA